MKGSSHRAQEAEGAGSHLEKPPVTGFCCFQQELIVESEKVGFEMQKSRTEIAARVRAVKKKPTGLGGGAE